MNNAIDIKGVIYSNSPIKFLNDELLKIISTKNLETIKEKTQPVIYLTGKDYADYVQESYSTGIDCKDIFADIGRYNGIFDEDQYFSNGHAGFAAPAILRPIAGLKSLSNIPLWDIRTFLGKSGSSSSLHFDWNSCPILLINLKGRKCFHLYSPSQSQNLQGYYNFTFVKPLSPDLSITLNENEGILIPPFWWHQAHYLSDAKSISIRFLPTKENLFLIQKMYPSWKFLQVSSIKDDANSNWVAEFEKIYDISNSAKELFNRSEELLNSKIHYQSEDHPFYKKYAIDFLNFRIFPKKNE
jgi:hypothetical protein